MEGLMLNIDFSGANSAKNSDKKTSKLGKSKPNKLPNVTRKAPHAKLASDAKPRKLTFIRAKSSKPSESKSFSLSRHIQCDKNVPEIKNKTVSETKENSNEETPFTVSFVKPKIHKARKNRKIPPVPQILNNGKVFDFDNSFERRPSEKWFSGNADREIRIDFPAKWKAKNSESKDANVEVRNDGEKFAESPVSTTVDAESRIAGFERLENDAKKEKPVKWTHLGDSKFGNDRLALRKSARGGKTFSKSQESGLRHGKWTTASSSTRGNDRFAADVKKYGEKSDADFEPVEEKLFSEMSFTEANVHPHLVGNLEQLFGIKNMTVVQQKTIPVLLAGKDALVRSQTGSGKTLAYALPMMDNLQACKPKLTRKDGVKALIILPTRELATQTYECFIKLMRAFTWIVPGLIIGGEKRKSEKVRLRKGITVLIGTPGRLLDHAENSSNLKLNNVSWLVIDEADRLLEMGYEESVSKLIDKIDSQKSAASWTDLPDSSSPIDWKTEESSEIKKRGDSSSGNNLQKSQGKQEADGTVEPGISERRISSRQTVLLSATLTKGVERLAALALKNPVHVDAASDGNINDILVIPQSLEQKYVVVPAKLRLVALASYIFDVTEKKSKILIFMATQDMVDYYTTLLTCVLDTSKFYKLHGSMTQGDRTEVFNSFRKADKGGVLLSTDVAARGLNFPEVDWIVQFTAPTTPAEYVHRVGRTARVGKTGHALIFLLPSELHFISLLQSSRVQLQEIKIDSFLKSLLRINLESKAGQWGGGLDGAATVLQHNFEHAVLDDESLHLQACNAFKSWVRFYATYPKDLRIAFDFKALHLGHIAKSFALRDPPKTIGGIGKPKFLHTDAKTKKPKKRKAEGLGFVSEGSRTKRLITSEFDSGLKPTKKNKF